MSGKALVVFALLAALLLSTAASSPESSAAGDAEVTNRLQQLLAQRQAARESAHRQEVAPQTHSARTERRAHLSEREREIMTKQVMQAISGMLLAGV